MRVDIRTIEKVVCKHYSVDSKQLFSQTRKKELKEIRQIFQYLARRYSKISFNEIGEWSNRNYATVMHSVNVVENLIHMEVEYRATVAEIEIEIYRAVLKSNNYYDNDVYGHSFEIVKNVLSCKNKSELNNVIRKLTPVF